MSDNITTKISKWDLGLSAQSRQFLRAIYDTEIKAMERILAFVSMCLSRSTGLENRH
jgi:hypothetical protein